jgi:pimeloyl-ACP methyl ester carboxylesterase
MNLQRKKIFNWLKIIIIIYCGIGIVLFYLQDKLLLNPVKLPATFNFSFNTSFKELSIPMNETDTLSVIHFISNQKEKKGIIIYFHGNTGNVAAYSKAAYFFTDKGYDVIMPDYPGFGKSAGELTEKKLYQQAYQVYKLAQQYFKEDSVIIYGQSFGAGIAANLATYSNAKHLILESPNSSIPDLYRSYTFIYPVKSMSNFKIPTTEFISDVKAPIAIFDAGNAFPKSTAYKLKELLKPTDKFIEVIDVSNKNLVEAIAYKKEMEELLK